MRFLKCLPMTALRTACLTTLRILCADRRGFLPFHAQFREAFPNIEVIVEDQIAEGDRVTTRCSVRGKHAGDSLGFAATQAPVEFTGVSITRIRDGKIVEAWNNFDFMKMYRELGAI